MSSEDATIAFLSASVNYDLENAFYPIAEFKWFHVARPGNGLLAFQNKSEDSSQRSAFSEGDDLISFDSQYATTNHKTMSRALGFRYSINESQNIGVAYESVLMVEEDNLMNDRITIDVILEF